MSLCIYLSNITNISAEYHWRWLYFCFFFPICLLEISIDLPLCIKYPIYPTPFTLKYAFIGLLIICFFGSFPKFCPMSNFRITFLTGILQSWTSCALSMPAWWKNWQTTTASCSRRNTRGSHWRSATSRMCPSWRYAKPDVCVYLLLQGPSAQKSAA